MTDLVKYIFYLYILNRITIHKKELDPFFGKKEELTDNVKDLLICIIILVIKFGFKIMKCNR